MTTAVQVPAMATTSFEPRGRSASYQNLPIIDTSITYTPKSERRSLYTNIKIGYEEATTSLATPPPASTASSSPPSPTSTTTHDSRSDSISSTPASSLTSDPPEAFEDCGESDELAFPSYDRSYPCQPISELEPVLPCQPSAGSRSSATATTATNSPAEEQAELPEHVRDDSAVEYEPTRHVDYLAHDWKEEEIWTSWRYIVGHRQKISNCVRLENAAWRTWVKAKYDLRTISPETLNWLKDCDVTWLYGPLQTSTKQSMMTGRSQPASRLSTSSSFICKKPILKKKSASAVILERSRSQHSLLQRASEIIRQQQATPATGRAPLMSADAEFQLPSYTNSSVANTPVGHETPSVASRRYSFAWPEAQTPADQKHVLFDETVRQVQAIDSVDDETNDTEIAGTYAHDSDHVLDDDETDADDGMALTMVPTRSTMRPSIRSTPRGSFCDETKTIVALPSTKLKKGRTDTPEVSSPGGQTDGPWPHRRLSPSPSQETLRPGRTERNFLIDDDAELTDDPWSGPTTSPYSPYEDEDSPGPRMRRTASGMFMPYEEDGDETVLNKSLYGQAKYAVNTFKDIAHVVWNVGWSRK